MRIQFGAVEQLRRFVGEQPLEPEQQREVPAPLDRGILGAGVDLAQRGVEGAPAGRSGCERLRVLAIEKERLAGELGRPIMSALEGTATLRGNFAGLGHRLLVPSRPVRIACGSGQLVRMPGSLFPRALSAVRIRRNRTLDVL